MLGESTRIHCCLQIETRVSSNQYFHKLPLTIIHHMKTIKVRITSMEILNICNLWILLRKIVKDLVGRKCRLDGLFRC